MGSYGLEDGMERKKLSLFTRIDNFNLTVQQRLLHCSAENRNFQFSHMSVTYHFQYLTV